VGTPKKNVLKAPLGMRGDDREEPCALEEKATASADLGPQESGDISEMASSSNNSHYQRETLPRTQDLKSSCSVQLQSVQGSRAPQKTLEYVRESQFPGTQWLLWFPHLKNLSKNNSNFIKLC
jgi:hypothetical protein